MKKFDYQILGAQFREIFDRYAARLGSEGRENVEHFFEVAELEMACESFVLSLIEYKVKISDKDKRDLMFLSQSLHLEKNSVFRADFWQIASHFFGSSSG